MNTASFVRHIVTWLGGIVASLAAMHWINADQVPGINEAATALGDPLLVVLGLVGALITRVAIAIVSKIFRLGAGEDRGSAGGLAPCVVALCMASVVTGMGLTSCTTSQLDAARAVPIRIGIEGPDARATYSSKSGLRFDAIIRATK